MAEHNPECNLMLVPEDDEEDEEEYEDEYEGPY